MVCMCGGGICSRMGRSGSCVGGGGPTLPYSSPFTLPCTRPSLQPSSAHRCVALLCMQGCVAELLDSHTLLCFAPSSPPPDTGPRLGGACAAVHR